MSTDTEALARSATKFAVPESLWNDDVAADLSPPELLLYRSNLLGSDLTVTNFGGGNTSAKLEGVDPLTGETVDVLWVKGSGGDIGSMKIDGFATLYQSRLLELEKHYSGPEDDDKMVGYLPHCTYNLNTRAASIDTPLHSLLPFAHIDHVHPDAIIALAASSEGEAATQEIWKGKIGWLPWKRPGFTLGVMIRDYVKQNPDVQGVMLAGHGIICWADTAKDCYEHTIQLIADAASYLNEKLGDAPAFGGEIVAPNPERRAIAAALMPKLRALMTGDRPKLAHYSDDAETLEFVGSADFERLARLGTSCPDHFLRTKIAPLTLDPERLNDQAYLQSSLKTTAQDMPDITNAARARMTLPCAMPTLSWSLFRALVGSPSPQTRPPPGSPASSTETLSMSCAALKPSAHMSRWMNKRHSTSNIGHWRKQNCSACQSQNHWSARLQLSPEALAELAPRPLRA